jgi:pilus assembly protein Flp/PilA
MERQKMRLVIKFLKDESAATAIEYGLIATGIAVAIIPVITGLGSKLKTTFSSISTALR